MSDSGFEFTIGDWESGGEGTADTSAGAGFYFTFGDASAFDSGASDRAGCSACACPHPAAHHAEADWVRLA